MKILKKDIRNDLKLLIELSCISLEKTELFEQFHKMLIAISYSATDVQVDYIRKRIYMNVVSEDVKGDFLIRIDNLVPTRISLNLRYEDFGKFLKASIKDKSAIPEQFYPLLKDQFFKGKSLSEKLQPVINA